MANTPQSDESVNRTNSPDQLSEPEAPANPQSIEVVDPSKKDLFEQARNEAKARLLASQKARAERIEQAKAQAEARKQARFEIVIQAKTQKQELVQAKPNRQEIVEKRVDARLEARAIEELDLQVVSREEGTSSAPPRAKSRHHKISALIFIGIPFLLSVIYFGWIASDQFYSVASFTIFSQNAGNSKGGLGGLLGGGASSTSTLGLQYIVQDYVASQQILEDIRPHLDIRKIYSNPTADSLVRLDPSVPEEKLLKYWNSMVKVHFDVMTGMSEIQVRAFTPQDAQRIAQQVLALSEALINRLSDRSRNDVVKAAQNEVNAAHKRVLDINDQLQAYANATHQIDPAAFAKSEAEIQSSLSQSLSQYKSQVKTLRLRLPEDAPTVQQLNRLIAATEMQLAEQKRAATDVQGNKSAIEMATVSAKLQLENKFASEAYLGALQFLEAAQLEATNRTFYLENYALPQLPQSAVYPQRVGNMLLTLLVSFGIWAIGSLIVSSLRR